MCLMALAMSMTTLFFLQKRRLCCLWRQGLIRSAAEQHDPPSRLGQVNEVMRFCEAKKRDGMSVKAVSEANQRRRARNHTKCSQWPLSLLSGTKVNDASMDGGVLRELGAEA